MIKKLKNLGFSKNTFGVFIVNWFFQKFLRINSRFPYLLHFTNKVVAAQNVILKGEGFHARKCLLRNSNIYINGSNGITIHNSCLITNSVKIISGNHNINDFDAPSVEENPIRVDANCWLGTNSVILPGVHLRESTIVGAGSVVTKSFNQSNIMIAGNPAKILKKLNEK